MGKRIVSVERMGKRIVFSFEGDLHFVLHRMIAGRLRWAEAGAVPVKTGKMDSATFAFSAGTLSLTEAGTQKRASLHVRADRAALEALHAGGIDPLTASAAEFKAALTARNHTLKRALTDPRYLSGIGNAYSDEILHRARCAIRWCSALSTRATKRTTARPARRSNDCWPIAGSRDCCEATGHARSRNWRS